ncbi:MAG TPA: AAA family ATPase [Candidatus Saccharimonadales bacterium]|nr:AAA family ATPase [Candidatus Saccharimonadales bacterium]
MKVLITGSPGTGKTSVVNELSAKGYAAFGPEDMGINKYFDSAAKKFVSRPAPPIDHARYWSSWDIPKLKDLLASRKLVFIADHNSMQPRYYDLFDKIIVLTADNDTLRYRLLHRDSNPNDYGKHPDELKHVMSYNSGLAKKLLEAPGAVEVDASKLLSEVVDEILSVVKD